jgi:hypothetical protein
MSNLKKVSLFQNSDSEKRLRNILGFFLSLSLIAPGFESTRRQGRRSATEDEESRGGG